MTDNPITFKLIKERLDTKTRPLKLKLSFNYDEFEIHNQFVRQIESQTFKVAYHEEVDIWIKNSGYEHQFITENPIAAVYTVIFTKAADAAHFKLVWC